MQSRSRIPRPPLTARAPAGGAAAEGAHGPRGVHDGRLPARRLQGPRQLHQDGDHVHAHAHARPHGLRAG